MKLDNTKNKITKNNPITGEKIQKQKTTEEIIETMIVEWNYEHCKLNEDEKNQIIESLKNMDIEKDWHSKWSEWVIFKIQIKDKNGQIKEYVAAKKRYDNNPDNERKIHQKVEDIVKETMPNSIVKVPELKAAITLPNEERFIIMEFVNGKTLYQLELEEIFRRWDIPTGEIKSDIEAEGLFFKILNLSPINPKDAEKAQKRYYQEIKNMKFFTPEQWNEYKTELRKFLQAIHKEWIYHRDGSNPRNIMITDDGKIYIIDFWKSKWVKNGKINEKDIYEKQEWENMIGVHPRDEEILTEIAWLTKDEEDMEIEKYQEEQKEKRKLIQSDKSIFEYINEIPKERIKNQKNTEIIKKLIKNQSITSKKINFTEMEEAKTKEELIVLLLAQSKVNIEEVLKQITQRYKILTEEINIERKKQINIPGYILRSGNTADIEKHKEHYEKIIEKIQKKIEKINDIEEKITYIQNKIA